jgi:hypothetical protein
VRSSPHTRATFHLVVCLTPRRVFAVKYAGLYALGITLNCVVIVHMLKNHGTANTNVRHYLTLGESHREITRYDVTRVMVT